MLAGIKEVLLISSREAIGQYRELLGDGAQFGISIEYKVQDRPEGIAQALILGEEFLEKQPCCLMLGDNMLYGANMMDALLNARGFVRSEPFQGATIFGYYVHDPRAYGVVGFDHNGRAISLEEKPERPKSNYAVPGIYFYDHRASGFARALKPSKRGELEITDLNRVYLEEGSLRVVKMRRGWVWLDAGTPDGLTDAAKFVQTIEKRQGLKIGCPEEAALTMGYITVDQLQALGAKYASSEYGQYLVSVAREAKETESCNLSAQSERVQ